MYSGTTLTRVSGNIIGAHQKIDRIARRELESLLPDINFPDITSILHFEGDHGPDGIKRKSPHQDEEWHFLNPFDSTDKQLINYITYHYSELVKALKSTNQERSAFEAAWLAHAIVDGLTPAHHYPYEAKLSELRQGESMDNRTTLKKKLLMPGETAMQAIKNNWKMWGPKGLFTTHAAFEMGVATLIAPLGFNDLTPASEYITAVTKDKVGPWFRTIAQQVAKLNLYDTFYKTGWTFKLSNQVKKDLAPTLINAVIAVWYCAYKEAESGAKLSADLF